MNTYQDTLDLLENLGRGKAKNKALYFEKKHTNSNNSRTPYNNKKTQKKDFIPTLSEMVHTALKKTQAIFKITKYGSGEKKIYNHLTYISRNGKLNLETQDGYKITNLKAQKQLLKEWSIDFGTRLRSRDTMHLVLSTPPGTDRKKSLEAAKEFLEKEFKSIGHDYVFVQHNDTDHPHVHCVIKMVSHIGKKLDPRKAYLYQVRKEYAKICRSHGINVEASSRAERGLSGESQRSEFVQMKKYQRRPNVDHILIGKVQNERHHSDVPLHPAEKKMQKRNQIIRKRYAEKALECVKKADNSRSLNRHKFYQAALVLKKHAEEMPIEVTRGEKLHRQMDDRYGVTENRLSKTAHHTQTLQEYCAVMTGHKNKEGIFELPTSIEKTELKNAAQKCGENNLKKLKKELGNGLELELDK